MNRAEVENRVNLLNENMLLDTKYELVLLKASSDYSYNKGIVLVEKVKLRKDWYSLSQKNCFKTWGQVDTFLDGFCLAKNTDFEDIHER